ncbi:hypothetical protein D9758_012343 [Tetrapyrgos nigripes]|uniref:Transmembrane protein n=1 Tax=Tetrapyrgos nigripes TaxID=182062 RepID=A0A8H5CNP6_9AGAR|nr:hypothetical protein D9758_012343 [Tetrapyrgos nigripes]
MGLPFMKPEVGLAVLFLTCSVWSATTNVTVEETSARIQYIGSNWIKNEQHELFHGGAHDRTQEDGGKAVFTFTGTAIYYYASLWPFNVSTVLTLDNEASQTLNLTDPDQPNAEDGPPTTVSDIRWQRTDLPNGLHTLTVERENYVLVDAFLYTTDDTKDVTGYDDTTSGSLQNVTVQESDPQITYTGDWSKNDASSLYSGGNHALSEDVAASAVFNFTGVAVYYHSSLWPFPVTTVLTFDDGPEEVLDLEDHSVPIIGDGPPTVESVIRWSRANLTDGQHSLTITTGSHALVDAITYTKTPADSSTTTSSNIEAGSPTAAATPSSGSSHSATVGGAVGGTLGGLLTLAALAVILFRRRRRLGDLGIQEFPSPNPAPRDMSSGGLGEEFDPSWIVRPFVMPSSDAATGAGSSHQKKGGHGHTVPVSGQVNAESSRYEPPPPSYRSA